MAKYLLTCDCGNNLEVENSQAGGRAQCDCGLMVNVPPLRQLRDLPVVEESSPVAAASGWSARKGVLSASLIAATVLAAVGGYAWFTSPKLQQFDPVARMAEVDRSFDTMTPKIAWQMWQDFYRGLDQVGFTEFQPRGSIQIKAIQQQHRLATTSAFSLAGIFALCALIAIFWPSRSRLSA